MHANVGRATKLAHSEIIVMRRRIERIVLNARTHAAVARELGLGLYQAVAIIARRRPELLETFARYEQGLRA